MVSTPNVALINQDMTIEEVIRRFPDTVSAFESYGLRCMGCSVSSYENIREGALSHSVDLDGLLEDLNRIARQ
jgi:hybrid cluster-associated redox disulfide protein